MMITVWELIVHQQKNDYCVGTKSPPADIPQSVTTTSNNNKSVDIKSSIKYDDSKHILKLKDLNMTDIKNRYK